MKTLTPLGASSLCELLIQSPQLRNELYFFRGGLLHCSISFHVFVSRFRYVLMQPDTTVIWGQDWRVAISSMVKSAASRLEATAKVLLMGLRDLDWSSDQRFACCTGLEDRQVLLRRPCFAETCKEHQHAASCTACSTA